MSQKQNARLPLTPGQSALLNELIALPNAGSCEWLAKVAGAFVYVPIGSCAGGNPTNGLQLIGSDVGLGGTLVQDTTIDGDTNTYNLSFNDMEVRVLGGKLEVGGFSIPGTSVFASIGTASLPNSANLFDSNSINHGLFTTDLVAIGDFNGTDFITIDYATGDIEVSVSNTLKLSGITADTSIDGFLVVDGTGIVYYRDITSLGFVQSVTGLDTDNTDPLNPIVKIAVDGVTITGDGTPGNPLVSSAGGSSFYQTVENLGVAVTQRAVLNLSSLLTASDVAGKTLLTVNESALTLNNLGGILGPTKGGTGLNAVSQGDLLYGSATNTWARLPKDTNTTRYLSNQGTNNNPSWNQVNLANGVTGINQLANGGSGSNLTDPAANKLWGWDDTDNAIGFWTIGTGLSYDHATHTLSADGISLISPLLDSGFAVGTFSTPTYSSSYNFPKTMTDVTTKRVFCCFNTGSDDRDSQTTVRIFKNDSGNFYQENEVTITPSDLTTPSGSITHCGWSKDSDYLYAVVSYQRNSGSPFVAIDVVRLDLDGTNLVATNIYSGSYTGGANTGAYFESGSGDGVGVEIVGNILYTAWFDQPTSDNLFRSFTISGTSYTPLTDYAFAVDPPSVRLTSIRFNPNNSYFYFMNNDETSHNSIDTWELVGTDILRISVDIQLPDWKYQSSGINENFFTLADMDFTSTTATTYQVSQMGQLYSAVPDETRGSLVIRRLTFPTFS